MVTAPQTTGLLHVDWMEILTRRRQLHVMHTVYFKLNICSSHQRLPKCATALGAARGGRDISGHIRQD
jgi:hypothetical protein